MGKPAKNAEQARFPAAIGTGDAQQRSFIERAVDVAEQCPLAADTRNTQSFQHSVGVFLSVSADYASFPHRCRGIRSQLGRRNRTALQQISLIY
jgi:hypothetical protein